MSIPVEDVNLAKKLCDPYINGGKRVVGQEIDTGTMKGMMAYNVGFSMSAVHALAMKKAETTTGDADYWKKLGEKAYKKSDGAGLWCDHSAGLIVYLLKDANKDFKSHLEVVSQGDPTLHGHWYVIANREADSPLNWRGDFHKDSFVIDIWGAIKGGRKSAVGHSPAGVFYDCSPVTIGESESSSDKAIKSSAQDKDNKITVICDIP